MLSCDIMHAHTDTHTRTAVGPGNSVSHSPPVVCGMHNFFGRSDIRHFDRNTCEKELEVAGKKHLGRMLKIVLKPEFQQTGIPGTTSATFILAARAGCCCRNAACPYVEGMQLVDCRWDIRSIERW